MKNERDDHGVRFRPEFTDTHYYRPSVVICPDCGAGTRHTVRNHSYGAQAVFCIACPWSHLPSAPNKLPKQTIDQTTLQREGPA